MRCEAISSWRRRGNHSAAGRSQCAPNSLLEPCSVSRAAESASISKPIVYVSKGFRSLVRSFLSVHLFSLDPGKYKNPRGRSHKVACEHGRKRGTRPQQLFLP